MAGTIGHNTMRAGLNAKTTHSAFLPQNFVTSDEKRILRIPGSASFLASYPTEPVPRQQPKLLRFKCESLRLEPELLQFECELLRLEPELLRLECELLNL